jgi:type II secretory pathway predicted ATPase ExeA
MDQKTLQALYGLKWNPFSRDIPSEALQKRPEIEHFCWRVENLVMDGGFALITGDPGTGKSAALRMVSERLGDIRDVVVYEFSRPQSRMGDFYREMGSLFGIDISASNRYGGHRSLREKWKAHIESTLFRPVIVIDEAQEMNPLVLTELRLLSSDKFDTKCLLTVILSGDQRLTDHLKSAELLPIHSRLRTKLLMTLASREQLIELLTRSIELAGCPNLMTEELIETLAEHAMGNCRDMMTAADELLTEAVRREIKELDAKLYIEFYSNRQGVQKNERAPGLTTGKSNTGSRTAQLTRRRV